MWLDQHSWWARMCSTSSAVNAQDDGDSNHYENRDEITSTGKLTMSNPQGALLSWRLTWKPMWFHLHFRSCHVHRILDFWRWWGYWCWHWHHQERTTYDSNTVLVYYVLADAANVSMLTGPTEAADEWTMYQEVQISWWSYNVPIEMGKLTGL